MPEHPNPIYEQLGNPAPTWQVGAPTGPLDNPFNRLDSGDFRS